MKKILMIVAALSLLIACQEKPLQPGGGQDVTEPEDGSQGEPKPEEKPQTYWYSEVNADQTDWSGDYLISYKSLNDLVVFGKWDNSKYGQPADFDFMSVLTENGIPAANADPYKAVITPKGNFYSIFVTGVGYIGYTGPKNSLSIQQTEPVENAFLWNITFKDCVWLTNAAASDRRLQWNNSAPRFAAYTGGQKELTLYKRTASDQGQGGGQTDPTPDPDPNPDPTPDPEPDPEPDPKPEIPDINSNGNTNGYLVNYEIPYCDVDMTPNEPYSSLVREGHGSTNAYIYDTKQDGYRIVTHTFQNTSMARVTRNYTFLYDYQKRCPIWLAYILNTGYCPKGGDRTDAWKADPAIPLDCQPNLKNSYAGGVYNRGHMLASHSRVGEKVANQQTFYYTNMAPQNMRTYNVGGGVWNELEDAEMSIVPSGRDTLYVVTGCIFEDNKTCKDKSGNVCAVPSTFYKCFVMCSFDASGKLKSAKGAAYYMPHHDPKTSNYNKYKTTIDFVESKAGIDLFANIPEEFQKKAELKSELNL